MNVQVRTRTTDSQRQNPNSKCRQVKPKRERASGSIRTVQEQLQSLLVKLSLTGSRSAVPGQKPNSRSLPVKAARAPPRQQQLRVQDSARCTSEPRDSRAVAMQPQGSRSQR